jgi:hypothetical protein
MPSEADLARARQEMAAGPPATPPAGNGRDLVKAAEGLAEVKAFAAEQKIEASADAIARQVVAKQSGRNAASRFTRGMN